MISKPEPGRPGPSVLRHRPGSTSSPPDPPRQRDQKRGILKGQNHRWILQKICQNHHQNVEILDRGWDVQDVRIDFRSVRTQSTGWTGWAAGIRCNGLLFWPLSGEKGTTADVAVSFRDLIHLENHHVRLSERQNPRIGTPKLFKMRRNYDTLLNVVSKSTFYSNQLPNSCSFSQFEPAICPNLQFPPSCWSPMATRRTRAQQRFSNPSRSTCSDRSGSEWHWH